LPSIDVPWAELEAGVPVAALLHRAGLAASKSEGRRLIKGGGARLNGEIVADEDALAGTRDLRDGSLMLTAGREKARPRPCGAR
jgi:tyrosyl-tRNA synthetase